MNEQAQPQNDSPWPRRLWWAGWACVCVSTLLCLVVPITPQTESAFIAAIFMLSAAFFLLITGALLIMFGGRRFFKQTKPLIFMIGLLLLTFYFVALEHQGASPIMGRLYFVGLVLGLGVIFSFGIGLALHLFYRDNSIYVAAITFLGLVWALLFYIRALGAFEFFVKIASLGAVDNLWFLYSWFCLYWWAIVLAPLSFLWHTLIFIRREWLGVRPL
jgi:hypothetical protein